MTDGGGGGGLPRPVGDERVEWARVVNKVERGPPTEQEDSLFTVENSEMLCRYRLWQAEEGGRVTHGVTREWEIKFNFIHDITVTRGGAVLVAIENEDDSNSLISVDPTSLSQTPLSPPSSSSCSGPWRLTCDPQSDLVLLYMKSSSSLLLLGGGGRTTFRIPAAAHFPGKMSQMKLVNGTLVVGFLDRHKVQVYSMHDHSKLALQAEMDAFWGNFASVNNNLFTSDRDDQRVLTITDMTPGGGGGTEQVDTGVKSIPMEAMGRGNVVVAKERHNNRAVHIFSLPSSLL